MTASASARAARRFGPTSSSIASLRLVALIVLLLAGLAAGVVSADEPNRAGLVINFGDGDIRVFVVEFDEPEITGLEMLERSGVDLVLTPFGGLGAGVCSIEHVGCPASNCFCETLSSPAVFWQYVERAEEGWRFRNVGAATRIVRDGDIDGWAWTDSDPGLPMLTFEEIAQIVDGAVDEGRKPDVRNEREREVDGYHSECPADMAVNMPSNDASVADPTPVSTAASVTGANDSSSGPPASYAGFAAVLLAIAAVLAWRGLPALRRESSR